MGARARAALQSDGQVHFPDCRIEYRDIDGREDHLDVEVTTAHRSRRSFSAAVNPTANCRREHPHGSEGRLSDSTGAYPVWVWSRRRCDERPTATHQILIGGGDNGFPSQEQSWSSQGLAVSCTAKATAGTIPGEE